MSRKGEIIGSVGGAGAGAAAGATLGSIGVVFAGTGVGIPIAVLFGIAGLIVGNKAGSEIDRACYW